MISRVSLSTILSLLHSKSKTSIFLNVYCFFISSKFSFEKINFFPSEVYSYTFLKNIGDIAPFIPSDKITLFYEM